MNENGKKRRYADWRPNLYHQIKSASSLAAVPRDLPLPPAVDLEVLHLFRCSTHTHTHPRTHTHTHTTEVGKTEAPTDEVKVRMKNEMKVRWR